jgi:hypothetical protein
MFSIFSWFPPNNTDVDGARRVEVLNGFRRLNPALVVPGHGDSGGSGSRWRRRSRAVGRRVRALRTAGMTAEQIIHTEKPAIVAQYPDWQHPGLLDWQIDYFAAQPT